MSYMLSKVVQKLVVFPNIKVSFFILKMQNLHSIVKIYVHVIWVRVKSLKAKAGVHESPPITWRSMLITRP